MPSSSPKKNQWKLNLMTSPKLWLTETMANETDTSLFRTVSDGFRRFRTVSDGFEPFSDGFRRFRTVFRPFRTVSGRVPAVSDDSNPNKKNSNFNWPGLGPVRAVPSIRAVPPSPGQLKFEFFTKNYLNRTQKIEKISKSF